MNIRLSMVLIFILLSGCYFQVQPPVLSPQSSLGQIKRVSVTSSGVQGSGTSLNSEISADGRFVVFRSIAYNLVPNDTNGRYDIFLHDRFTNLIERISLTSSGSQANGDSFLPSVSADGRYIAFYSSASALVPGDTNTVADIYLRDRVAGTTTRISVDSNGNQANGPSYNPSISDNGRYVAYLSYASNLVANDSNNVSDIFVYDRLTTQTVRVSVDSSGLQANAFSLDPAISGNGRVIAFRSAANNLIAGDTNALEDVFVNDLITGETKRASIGSSGAQGNNHSGGPSINADGTVVAFHSYASTLAAGDTNNTQDIFVHNFISATTERVSITPSGQESNNHSVNPSISASGRYLTFSSLASNLIPDTNGVHDVFWIDRQSGLLSRLSESDAGAVGNGASTMPKISADGQVVSFESIANNLVANDTNTTHDIFTSGVSFTSGGTLDSSFSNDGIATLDFNQNSDQAYAVTHDLNHKLVVAGYSEPSSTGFNVTLTRFNPDGSLDTNFGTYGKATRNQFRLAQNAASMVIDQSNGIVLAGTSNQPYQKFAITRFQANGLPDYDFGQSGIGMAFLEGPVGLYSDANAIAIDQNGKFVVAGWVGDSPANGGGNFAVARFNANGTLDSTFANNGTLSLDLYGFNDIGKQLLIDSNNKIIIAGVTKDNTARDFALVRLNPDGSLDPTFGNGGKITTDFAGNVDQLEALMMDSNGQLFLVGAARDSLNATHMAVAKYTQQGSLDGGFGVGGKLMTTFVGENSPVYANLDWLDRMIVVGVKHDHMSLGNDNVAIARYTANGTLDLSFGNNGSVITTISNDDDYAHAVTIDPSGKIVIAGAAIMEPNSGDFMVARYHP